MRKLLCGAVGLLGFAAAGFAATALGGTSAALGPAGLPQTRDYHSLLVDPGDSQRLVLGTHNGLYVSGDGGRHWRFDALARNDAMHMARSSRKTVWIAGHNVFKKSVDAGKSWTDIRPSGLPHLDIHGFAVDARRTSTLYAALANVGLYRSTNGGNSFSLVSDAVGGTVMALVALPDGRLLAADQFDGLNESRDGGKTWRSTLRARFFGLAVNPSDPRRILATGAGIALSTDGGRKWLSALDLAKGAGPVAWSSSNPKLAYAVGFNRKLYRSGDSGVTWKVVPPGK